MLVSLLVPFSVEFGIIFRYFFGIDFKIHFYERFFDFWCHFRWGGNFQPKWHPTSQTFSRWGTHWGFKTPHGSIFPIFNWLLVNFWSICGRLGIPFSDSLLLCYFVVSISLMSFFNVFAFRFFINLTPTFPMFDIIVQFGDPFYIHMQDTVWGCHRLLSYFHTGLPPHPGIWHIFMCFVGDAKFSWTFDSVQCRIGAATFASSNFARDSGYCVGLPPYLVLKTTESQQLIPKLLSNIMATSQVYQTGEHANEQCTLQR